MNSNWLFWILLNLVGGLLALMIAFIVAKVTDYSNWYSDLVVDGGISFWSLGFVVSSYSHLLLEKNIDDEIFLFILTIAFVVFVAILFALKIAEKAGSINQDVFNDEIFKRFSHLALGSSIVLSNIIYFRQYVY